MRMTRGSISGLNNSRSHTYFSNGSEAFDQSFPNVKASMVATVRRTPATHDAFAIGYKVQYIYIRTVIS